MIIDHLTLGGISLVSNSNNFPQATINELTHFQIKSMGKIVLPYHKREPSVKVEVISENEFTVFNLMVDDRIFFSNVCCFDEENTEIALAKVLEIGKQYHGDKCPLIESPYCPNWVYSIAFPIDDFVKYLDKIILFKSVERYIYYSLLLGRDSAKVKTENNNNNNNNLKPISEYLKVLKNNIGPGYRTIIQLDKLRNDGLELTRREGDLISNLMYDGLTGYLPMFVNGKIQKVKVHEILEAVGEYLHGIEFNNKIGISHIKEAEMREIAYSIFEKFGYNPNDFMKAAKDEWNELGAF